MKRTTLMPRGLLLIPLLAGLVLVSCGKEDFLPGGPTGEPGTLERVYSYSAIQACSTCHGPGGDAEDGPDMSTAASFRSSMVNRSYDDYDDWFPITRQCSNAGLPYISPGSPDNSAVLAALVWSYADGNEECEGTYGYHDLQKATIDDNHDLMDDLVLWIENGANP